MSFTIHNKIAHLRNDRGVTQEELGKAVEVSRQTIIALEKGNYIPSLLLAFRISSYFGCTVEEIFSLKVIENED